jgi:hypothetical protein
MLLRLDDSPLLGDADTDELERAFPAALDGNPHPRPWHDEPATAAREWCGGCGRLLGVLEFETGAALCVDCEP